MLKSLYIESFVIIDHMNVDFHDGMSALTGETGAGKSIIIDAIGQLCGNRSNASLVRKGKDKAVIEGVFEVDESDALHAVFDELSLDFDTDIVVTKTITAQGKSTIKINYRSVTNSALRLLAPYLIHIHSQFESQTLFSFKNHLRILDAFAGEKVDSAKDAYRATYDQWKDVSRKIRTISEEDMSDEAIEFYQANMKELQAVDFTDDDVDAMENELALMKSHERLSENMAAFDNHMNGSRGALTALHEALDALGTASDYEGFSDLYDELYNEYETINDTYQNVMDLFARVEFDEYRFNELQETLFTVRRLQNKYGYSMDDLARAREELQEKIDAALHREEILAELESRKTNLFNELTKQAQTIHEIREDGARQFEEMIANELRDLMMPQASLKVDFKDVEPASDGCDQVTFMVAMNAGQGYSPLSESASGGEISRMMLAIKMITLRDQLVDTVIFDEVDSGVSGKAASAIGAKMARLAQVKQVICITHLPQVAVYATHHYAIEKSSEDNETYTNIHPLDQDGRIGEIAKMLSGDSVSEEALVNARHLLEESR